MILGSIACIHLYETFWITIIDLDLPYNLNCYLFCNFCFHFLDISDIISYRSVILLTNQRLPFLLLVDIGYSVVLFLFLFECVCVYTV